MPDAFSVGPVLIPTLRAGIIVSLLFAIWVAARIAGYMNLESGLARRVAETSVWLGLIGAGLGFVVTNWSAFRDTPWTALYFWQPGYLPVTGLLVGAGYTFWRLRHQEPRLRYIRALDTRGVTIVGIDLGESMDLVRAYAQSIGVTYPIWVDAPTRGPEFNRTHELYNRFGGIGLPTTFFIDANGIIRDRYIGELNRAFLQNRIEAMLTR